jgi:hypothetical protein
VALDEMKKRSHRRQNQSIFLQLLMMSFMLCGILFLKCGDSQSTSGDDNWIKYLILPADLHLPKSVLDLELEAKKSTTQSTTQSTKQSTTP